MITFIDQLSPAYKNIANHPLQTWEWGDARLRMGVEVKRLGEFRNQQLKSVFQFTIHQIPYLNHKIGYLPRSVFPTNEVLEFLYDYGKRNQVIFIKIEPYLEKSQIINYKLQKNFKLIKSPHPLFPDWTIVLDLIQSEDELLKKMHPKTRYNIRLAQRKGVVVKEMSNDQGFKIFSELYFETCKRQQYFGHNQSYHQSIWHHLKNNIAHLLIAFYQDIPLAAYEIFIHQKIAYYPYGGSSLKYRNYMPTNLLMWEAIQFAKKLGAEKFDMWGSLPKNHLQNHPWVGFTRFKQGYGGKLTQLIGSYDLVINPSLYRIYNLFYLFRQQLLKIKRAVS